MSTWSSPNTLPSLWADQEHANQERSSGTQAPFLHGLDPIRRKDDIGRRVVSDISVESYHTATSSSPPVSPSHGSSDAAQLHRYHEPTSITRQYPSSGTRLGSPVATIQEHNTCERSSGQPIASRESDHYPSDGPMLVRANFSHRGPTGNSSPRPTSSYTEDVPDFDPSDPNVWSMDRVLAWLENNSFGKDWHDSFLKHKIQYANV